MYLRVLSYVSLACDSSISINRLDMAIGTELIIQEIYKCFVCYLPIIKTMPIVIDTCVARRLM